MSADFKKLARGAAITAVATLCGVITGFPAIDPEHFNVVSFHGLMHISLATLWIIFTKECWYIQEWLKTINGKGNGNAT